MRLHKLTILSSYLIRALEETHGQAVPAEEFCERIFDGTIFAFLSERFGLMVGVSVLTPADKLELLMEWEDMALALPPSAMGLKRDGLLLLLRYLMEGIQRRSVSSFHRLTDEPIVKEQPPSCRL
jgi:hypothetical protein